MAKVSIPDEEISSLIKRLGWMEPSVKKDLIIQLNEVRVYPEAMQTVLDRIESTWFKSKIEPGTSIGTITSQRCSHQITQSSLSAFHSAGSISGSREAGQSGIKAINSLLNLTKLRTNAGYHVRYIDKPMTREALLKHRLQETPMQVLQPKYESVWSEDEKWELPIYAELIRDDIPLTKGGIIVTFNPKSMYKKNLTPLIVANRLNSEREDIVAIPYSIEEMKIIVLIKPDFLPETTVDVNTVMRGYSRVHLPRILSKTVVSGLTGVKQVYPVMDPKNGEWYYVTNGGKVASILSLDDIDADRLYCDDPRVMFDIFGITGARYCLRREFNRVLGVSSKIVPEDIEMLVSVMTHNGYLQSISRHQMGVEEYGPMGKILFEELKKQVCSAAFFGESDSLRSSTSSVAVGKPGVCGTGSVDLVFDFTKGFKTPKIPTIVDTDNTAAVEAALEEGDDDIVFSF